MNFPLIEQNKELEMKLRNILKNNIKKTLCVGLVVFAAIVLLVGYASGKGKSTMVNCIFCDIVAGKLPNTQIEVDAEDYVIFKDIKPASTNHYLCVTKKHIESLKAQTKDDIPLINSMEEGLQNFFKSKDIDIKDSLFGFHMPPFISVHHLHMHGIAPRSNMSWMNSFMFTPSYWFKTVQDGRNYLIEKS